MRRLLNDLDDTVGPNCTCSDDPFVRPDYRGKKHTRPIGRVVHKRKPRRAKAARVIAEVVG